jgi:hypothetical protein
MIKALMAGAKTQTRRTIRIDDTPISKRDYDALKFQRGIPSKAENVRLLGYLKCDAPPGSHTVSSRVHCPYGVAGDRLWVREAFALKMMTPPADDYLYGKIADLGIRKYGGGGPPPNRYDARRNGDNVIVQYRCNPRSPAELHASPGFDCWMDTQPERWRPGIFMPRWASRITLEVTNVRVEQLHKITEADARAEGVTPFKHDPEGDCWTSRTDVHRAAFEYLWCEINGWSPNAWAKNPWVWVVEFKRVDAQARAA